MSAIEGTVRDASGAPVEGAIVYVDETSRATTDARGAYRIDGLAAGTYSATAGGIAIIPERHHPDGDRHRRWFALADGETKADVDIHVRRGGGCITGVVRDRKGAPIAGARVSVARSRSDDIGGERRLHAPTVETDAGGRYSAWISEGCADIMVVADGFAEEWHLGGGWVDSERRDFELARAGSIAGIVVDDATGDPIEGAHVNDHTASAGPDGRFVLAGLAPDLHRISARSDRGDVGALDARVDVLEGENAEGIVVRTRPTGGAARRIAGRVMVGSPPRPCLTASVYVDNEMLIAAADGTFHAEHCPPGEYDVQVSAPGRFRADIGTLGKYPKLVVGDHDLLDLEWVIDPGATLHGRLVRADGSPVADAEVRVVLTGEQSGAAIDITSPHGAFIASDLPPGIYRIDAPGLREELVLAPEVRTVDRVFVVPDRVCGDIHGTVTDASGAPVPDASISVADHPFTFTRSAEDGTFRLCLEPGMYGISARRGHYDGEVRRTRVEVIAHAVVEIALPVHVHPGTISGIVVDPSGAPIAHAQVWIDHDEPHHANVRTLADGAFVLRDLSPTTHTIVARHDALGASRVVKVTPDGEALRLTIESFASIAGRVTPVSGPFTIRVGDRFERFDRANGTFALDRIPQGATEVFACDDTGDGILAIALAPGETRRDLALALLPRTAATGRILDRETGAPLANASAMIGGEWVTTDDEGRFHVPHVSVGRPIPFSVRRHTWLRVLRVVEPGPEPIDLGDWLV